MTRLKRRSPLRGQKHTSGNPLEAYLKRGRRSVDNPGPDGGAAASSGTPPGRTEPGPLARERRSGELDRARSTGAPDSRTRPGLRKTAPLEISSPRRSGMTTAEELGPVEQMEEPGVPGQPTQGAGNSAGESTSPDTYGRGTGGCKDLHQNGPPQSPRGARGEGRVPKDAPPVPAPRSSPPVATPRNTGQRPPDGHQKTQKGYDRRSSGSRRRSPPTPENTTTDEEDSATVPSLPGSPLSWKAGLQGTGPHRLVDQLQCSPGAGSEGPRDTHKNQSPKSNREAVMFEMMQALPTRLEMEKQLDMKLEGHANRLEGVVRQELKVVQETLQGISQKIAVLEEECGDMKGKMAKVERASCTQRSQLMNLALQVMDLENRQRRNNIRFRGIPESVGSGELKSVVSKICNFYLKQPPQENIEIDRAHRVSGNKGAQTGQPRDVLCRIHFFSTKEAVMRAAWDKGAYELEGKQIILLQDLSSKTLKMRRALKPLLEAATKQGASYRWGYPFAVTFRRNGKFLTVRSQDQLSAVFEFLGIKAFEVPDWRELALE